VVATEWRNNVPGQRLRNRLTLNGLQLALTVPAASQINTVLLAARGIKGSQSITPANSPVGDLASIQRRMVSAFLAAISHNEWPSLPFSIDVLKWPQAIRIGRL
jgi:hypothetical protein